MNVMITGGTGFVGSHLVEELLFNGYQVSILSNSAFLPKNLAQYTKELKLIQGDFGDTNTLQFALKGIDKVVHLAWTTVPQTMSGSPVFDVQSNVIGTVNLLEQCVGMGIEKFVFISSGGTVYGIPNTPVISESHSLNPISSYGICKLAAEKYIQLYHHLYGLDYAILRVSNAYGEYQNLLKGQGVIGIWLRKIKNSEVLEIWGDGSVIRDYVYVKDLAIALSLALERTTREKTFNIGAGVGHSLNQLLEIIKTEVPFIVRVEYKESRKIDVSANVLDISQAKEVLGWSPSTQINEGIHRVWKWLFNE